MIPEDLEKITWDDFLPNSLKEIRGKGWILQVDSHQKTKVVLYISPHAPYDLKILSWVHDLITDLCSQLTDHDACQISLNLKTGHFTEEDNIGALEPQFEFGDVILYGELLDWMT